ncbi:hypothetical protein AGMMS49545_20250 [Betaproteobacteria bacterium]|nr:hypothetical protein AGMMS49545_20250 [Betaproteobacteria bacterium]GHU41955.1 hypothetical protein AGMMS50289_05930 [Betaproteobacteria bacterium]
MRHATAHFQTIRKLLLSLFLGALFFCTSAHGETALQPAQVSNLYLKVLINQDIRSATEINDYMRPYNGRNVFDLQVLKDLKNDIAPTDAQDTPVQTEHERLFLKALMEAARRSTCHATASELERDAATGNQIANVEYVCRIPDARIQTALNAYENEAASDLARAGIMSEIVAKLNNAPTEKEIIGILQLEELKADGKSWWHPASVDDTANLLNFVLGNLLSE